MSQEEGLMYDLVEMGREEREAVVGGPLQSWK